MKRIFLSLAAMLMLGMGVQAQRLQQPLGRGVVAVENGSGMVTITWRRLAQEPEATRYNVYVNGKKLNSTPLLVSNLQVASSKVPVGSPITVTSVVGGKESEPSTPFVRKTYNYRNIFVEIPFQGGPLDNASFETKYVWPCDLDGNGEMDYVVDRNGTTADCHYVEAYRADGTYLWTIDMGPNECISLGQDDQVTAFDIDCDGKGEVILQTSDGTRFWDKEKGTWGLYVKGKTTGDTDGDGIIDYNTQGTKNPPRYFTVVDGMTGAEKVSVEQRYDDAYNRTNKASLMGDEYNKHVGHVGIFYPDGKHPAIVMEWHTRTTSGTHQYRNSAFGFDFDANGKASNWHQLFMEHTGGSQFHQIRIFDADGDGRDEMSSGAYCMDHDGSTLYNTRISHGDRHRTSDIDPERPGLETFSIQQNAGDMLGQILFDAGTGEPIKKWYLSSVGDVGRGECIDIDPNHLGWEMWSTMDGVYDAKGDLISGLTHPYPTEGVWWDGDLGREMVHTSDSHYNVYIDDFQNGRLIQPGKESGYTIRTVYAARAAFWGDIIGDWREELMLLRMNNGVNVGIVGITTDLTTSVNNIYCLLQDPHYCGDCTTKGYYQAPDPGFYLGYNMPRPPLPPVMQENETSQVFDLSLGNATITPDASKQHIYVMAVKGQTLTIGSPLQLPQGGELWKSQQGTLALTAPIEVAPPSGGEEGAPSLIISEGVVTSTSEIAVPISLRARGTLAGSPIVQDTITFEGALNYEGCRLMPQGTMTFQKGLTLRNRVFMEMSLSDLIHVDGNLNVSGTPIINIKYTGKLEAGEYKLIEYTGELKGFDKFTVQGLTGLKYKLEDKDQAIYLIVEGQREATTGVLWSGAQNGVWDYQTENWTLAGEATEFVAGDEVTFTDDAKTRTVTMNELIPAGKVTFNNTQTYTLNGDGGFSGKASLTKEGTGSLVINTTKSDYTGTTTINAGSVTVKALADTGIESSLGSSGSIRIGQAKLIINNSSTSTDRSIVLTDSATIQVGSGTTALKGVISGTGKLTKTGTGQLNINNSGNTWSGGTVLNAGTLAQGSWNAQIGKAGSIIEVTGNTTYKMFDSNSSGTMPNTNYVFDINKGKTLTLYAGSRCNVNGSLRGEGTYKISLPYVRADISTNTSAFQGTYDVMTSNCRFVTNMDLSKATLKLEDAAYVVGVKAGGGTEQSYTHKVGSLTGTGGIGMSTWNVGYLGQNDTYAGVFGSSATVNKYGEGTWTLTGASSGALNVYEGAVQLNCTTAPTTTGTVTVRNGAMACGTGKAAAVSVQKGGTLKAGKVTGTTVGTLSLTGNLTVSSGGVLEFRTRISSAGKATCDAIKADGTVKLTSPVLNIVLASGEYADGQEFTLFTGNLPTITGTVTFTEEHPAPGFKWDTSDLSTRGILRIVADPDYDAISEVEANVQKCASFDLSGRKLANGEKKKGVVIVNGKKVVIK